MRLFAPVVGASRHDIVFVPNVTTAINAILRSFPLYPGETVYLLDISYGAVKKIVLENCKRTGAKYHEEHVNLPIKSPEELIQLVSKTLPPNTKLAVFDYITSNTALLLPIKKISKICHDRGILVLIDAAHALGQIPITIEDLEVDFLTGNCHKWFCCPSGSAFLWTRRVFQYRIKPLTISLTYDENYSSAFSWAGCFDYAPILSITTALKFWRRIGTDRAMTYMHKLTVEAAKMLSSRWGTEVFATNEMIGSMVLIRLPINQSLKIFTSAEAKYIQDLLHFDYRIEVPIKTIHGQLYIRISCHIYNTLEHYITLSNAVIDLCSRLEIKAKM